ncbi:MAG TPA: MbnP family copper-binding protein [Candidatus Binatia bacterium]|nr:MbnP family copper-binding protein [Candidatus Binatia bacterium]
MNEIAARSLRAICGLAVLLAGCHRDVAVDIPFVATIRGEPFSCDRPANGFTPFDLRFYVYGVELLDQRGATTPVRLTNDDTWQHDGVALLDFETGSGTCADGTRGTHMILSGHVDAGRYVGLRFVVGVPFERNHADPTMADPPLNLGRMHWGWQGGFKFFRFEGNGPHGAVRVHLGSTGCAGTIGHITECARPNRAVVQLDGFVPGRNRIALDLAPLVAMGGVRPDAKQPASCMSDMDDNGCRVAFDAFGLDLQTGKPLGAQHLFSSQPL